MRNYENLRVVKKDGTIEDFNPEKIVSAIRKSAARVMVEIPDDQAEQIVDGILEQIEDREMTDIPIADMHNFVECMLDSTNPAIAKSYRDYRNYKMDFVHIMDKVFERSQTIRFLGDKENSNTNSALVATKRCLIFNELNKRLYRRFFMTQQERQACREGYIYIHDQSARMDTMNCLDRSTRFITDNGIRSFKDYDEGDTVTVLTHKGNWKKATVHSYGEQELQRVFFAKPNQQKPTEVLVTANHRWILKDGSETTELKVGDIIVKSPIEDANESGNYEVVAIATSVFKNIVWCLDVEDDHSFILEGGIPTGNCCLFDVEHVLKGGFEMGNVWYTEPKTLDVAFDVIGDIILSAASQQYGGFTVPEIDKILDYYAQKSFNKYMKEYEETMIDAIGEEEYNSNKDYYDQKAIAVADKKVERDFEQGFQGIEMKLNTVGSSRGDYPFITMTLGLGRTKFAKMGSKAFLKVHRLGEGKEGKKKPVTFPKIVFLYDENLHGPGKELEDVYEAGIECSCATMYPKSIGA